jgi:hypothetical protein
MAWCSIKHKDSFTFLMGEFIFHVYILNTLYLKFDKVSLRFLHMGRAGLR